MIGDLDYCSFLNLVGAAAEVNILRTPKGGEFSRSYLHKLGVELIGMFFPQKRVK